jgi:hypothetical protein
MGEMSDLAERVVLFEHPRISVWCYPTRGLVHHQMHSACAGDPFRDALTAGLAALQEHECTRWLSDDRMHEALAPEDEDWAQDVWFPQAKASGWRHWAVIQPKSAVGNLSSARFRQWYAKHGINAKLFTDVDEAHAWLARQR